MNNNNTVPSHGPIARLVSVIDEDSTQQRNEVNQKRKEPFVDLPGFAPPFKRLCEDEVDSTTQDSSRVNVVPQGKASGRVATSFPSVTAASRGASFGHGPIGRLLDNPPLVLKDPSPTDDNKPASDHGSKPVVLKDFPPHDDSKPVSYHNERKLPYQSKPVHHIRNGLVVETFPSIKDACLGTGINRNHLYKLLSDKSKTNQGSAFRYVSQDDSRSLVPPKVNVCKPIGGHRTAVPINKLKGGEVVQTFSSISTAARAMGISNTKMTTLVTRINEFNGFTFQRAGSRPNPKPLPNPKPRVSGGWRIKVDQLKDGTVVQTFSSIRAAACDMGVSHTHMTRIIEKMEVFRGFTFRRADAELARAKPKRVPRECENPNALESQLEKAICERRVQAFRKAQVRQCNQCGGCAQNSCGVCGLCRYATDFAPGACVFRCCDQNERSTKELYRDEISRTYSHLEKGFAYFEGQRVRCQWRDNQVSSI